LINRLPSPALQNDSPFSKLFNNKKNPNYASLRAFGYLCYPLLRPYANHKLSFRSKPCILIGYGANQRGYQCLDPKTHKVCLSKNVIFDETQFLAKHSSLSHGSCKVTTSPGNSLVMIPSHLPIDSLSTVSSMLPNHPDLSQNTHIDSSPLDQHDISTSPTTFPSPSSSESSHHPSSTSDAPLPLPSAVPTSRTVTRSQIGHLKPKEYPSFKMFHTIKHPLYVFQTVQLPPEPSTYKQAATKPERIHAMNL
jgi:hypothetical protein